MEAFRLSSLLRRTSSFSLQKFLPFSSSSSAAKYLNFICDGNEEGSPFYRHKLMFQRPTTMKWDKRLCNSASFIGSVLYPLKMDNSNKHLSVHTLLDVRSYRYSDRTFRILVRMKGEMAEISLQHLRPNDFIYVSGQLQYYTKVDLTGKLRTFYSMLVKELNYVAQSGQYETGKKLEKSKPKESRPLFILGASDSEKNRKDRLYLWQVFFANPNEWWDNRHGKVNPKAPDFKHKDTGEALWLSSSDPPWVTRQLELHDSRMGQRRYQDSVGSHSREFFWEYTDEELFSEFEKKEIAQGS